MAKRPDPMADILFNHDDYPDPVSKMSARALIALDTDDMDGLKAALDCIRVITCARTRDEAMDIADEKGLPRSVARGARSTA